MTLYNKKDIATLLDKFMAGATTIEEEQTLADYFRSEQRVPAEWEDYKDMFAYFDNGMVEVSEQKRRYSQSTTCCNSTVEADSRRRYSADFDRICGRVDK